MEKEVFSRLIILVIGATISIASLNMELGSVHHPGMGFLPFLTGVCLTLVAFFSLVTSFLTGKREMVRKKEKFFEGSVLNVAVMVVCMGIYTIILPWFGYLPSTFLLLIFLFKAGGLRRWYFVLMSALVATCFSYLLFSSCLHVRFPRGIVGL